MMWNCKLLRDIMCIAVAEYMEKNPKYFRNAMLYLAEFDILKL